MYTLNARTEAKKTAWYSLLMLAKFLRSKTMLNWCDEKVIVRIYIDGKFKDGIKFNVKK